MQIIYRFKVEYYFSLLVALIEFIVTSEMPADRLLRESFHSSRQSTWMLMRQSRSERDSCKRRTTLKEEWVPMKGWQRPWGEAARTSAATSGVSKTRKEVLYFTNKNFKFARGTELFLFGTTLYRRAKTFRQQCKFLHGKFTVWQKELFLISVKLESIALIDMWKRDVSGSLK